MRTIAPSEYGVRAENRDRLPCAVCPQPDADKTLVEWRGSCAAPGLRAARGCAMSRAR